MMTEEAIAARREYKRQWQRNNPDKVREQQARYWIRKAKKAAEQLKESEPAPDQA